MADFNKLAFSYYARATIKPNPHNAHQNPPHQIRKIAKSIAAFGFIAPIVIDTENQVVTGNGRLAAAELLGLEQIPTVRVDHLSEAQRRAYALADNKLAEGAGWDENLLKVEINYLIDANFEVTITGFDPPEIDQLLTSSVDTPETESPCFSPPEPEDTVSELGDLWYTDGHRLLGGDCRDREAVAILLDGVRVALAFLDVPYNLRIAGNVRRKDSGHKEFLMASGDMSREEFESLLYQALSLAASVTRNGGVHMLCIDWRHLHELLGVAEQIYDEQLNLVVWNKTNAGMGSLYRSQHELILVYKVGVGPHVNNVQLGKFGRNRTNVWTYPGANAFGKDRDEALAMHPTVKPAVMVADAILDVTHRGDAVFDGFCGSGTTLVAAHQTHRVGYGIELNPAYVDVALHRLRRETGIEPVLAETGEGFDTVAERRLRNKSDNEEIGDE